jgi:REase_DpnII-MboI
MLHAHPDERAVVKLAALQRLLALEADINLHSSTTDDLVAVLQQVPAALKRWPWEGAPRTNRKGLLPQRWDIATEYHIQAFLWALLRPISADLRDEEYLRSLGYKHPRVDLAIPRLRLIIEVKFLYTANQAELAQVQEDVAADTSLYLSEDSGYDKIIAFVWDSTASVQHHATLAQGLRKLRGIYDAIVVSRPGSWRT